MARASVVRAVVVAVAAAVGCGGDDPALFLPQVSNNVNDFQLLAPQVSGVTFTAEYPWRIQGSVAEVHQSSLITGGTATLAIVDSFGTEVYQASLADTGLFVTQNGAAGRWTISLILNNASGAIGVSVRRP